MECSGAATELALRYRRTTLPPPAGNPIKLSVVHAREEESAGHADRLRWLLPTTLSVTAIRILNDHARPFFEQHRVNVQTIMSDNGREYCDPPDKHPYELFLTLEEIEHRTVLEEHFRIRCRPT